MQGYNKGYVLGYAEGHVLGHAKGHVLAAKRGRWSASREPVIIADHIQALRTHRAMGHDVFLVDPFGITRAPAYGLN